MSQNESKRLADFSNAVRLSTLKRLRAVPSGQENFRATTEAMSFAEHALHLIDCDNYLFDRLEGKNSPPQYGRTQSIKIRDRAQYEALIKGLESSGNQRAVVIESLTDDDLSRTLDDARFGR